MGVRGFWMLLSIGCGDATQCVERDVPRSALGRDDGGGSVLGWDESMKRS